jgi:uncharacterized repeat protein (TIGR03803 family)
MENVRNQGSLLRTGREPARIAIIFAFFTVLAATGLSHAQTFNVVYTFTDSPDGANPVGLIRDAQGNLYGTTEWGGDDQCGPPNPFTCGTVFEVDKNGVESVLYAFTGQGDGANPVGGVIRDAAGNLYGTTQGNGTINAASTIFKVDSSGNETVLHTFNNGTEGCCADSPLWQDAAGNLYGSAPFGGNSSCGIDGLGCGTLFSLAPSGKFTVIHTFAGTDGMQPEGGLVSDGKANLYGVTLKGGNPQCLAPTGCGTVFQLDKNGKLTVLHAFNEKGDGRYPLGVIRDTAGNLYGIAEDGGDMNCNSGEGCGTIFKVDSAGAFSVLYTFTPTTSRNPAYANHLYIDGKGNLYGIKQLDGANNAGFLFELATNGNFTDLYDFAAHGTNGDGSMSVGFVAAGDGIFGVMELGGISTCGGNPPQGCGTVFQLTP